MHSLVPGGTVPDLMHLRDGGVSVLLEDADDLLTVVRLWAPRRPSA